MSGRVEIYRETIRNITASPDVIVDAPKLGGWRWRFVKNGRTMADSGQAYSRRIDCLRGAEAVTGGRLSKYEVIGGEWVGIIVRLDDSLDVIDLTKSGGA